MKNKDDLFLEQLYQEGIWDRLKGQGAGIKQGAGTVLKNIGGKLTGDTNNRPSARGEYAKAQQSSLLKSFVQKVKKEIEDFKNDLKIFKVDSDPDSLKRNFPIISQRLEEIENLEKFLANPNQTPNVSTPTSTNGNVTASQSPKVTTPTSTNGNVTASQSPKVNTNFKDYLNLKDAAAYLKVSETELQNLAATKKIKTNIFGGKPLFHSIDLDEYNFKKYGEDLKSQETPSTPVTSSGDSPKKGDKVTYLNDPSYVFNGNAWEYKGKEVVGQKLIDNLNKSWQDQKTMKTKSSSSTKPKMTANKKPVPKTAVKTNSKVKAPAKKATQPSSGTKVSETKVGPSKTRYTYKNESYNPFSNFLEKCNLI
jgi:hypothetical protein